MLQAVLRQVLIRPEVAETVTKGGIHLVPQGKQMPTRGEVLSVGDLVKDIKVGQHVLFKKWEAMEIKWEGENLLSLEDKNILATLDEPVQ